MLDSIESAIEDIRNGKMVIVVDDEDRENEGDFVTAARNASPEVINFMSKHGRGLICATLTTERCEEPKARDRALASKPVEDEVDAAGSVLAHLVDPRG